MAMKKASHTRHGIRGKFPPKKNGCFGNTKPVVIIKKYVGKEKHEDNKTTRPL